MSGLRVLAIAMMLAGTTMVQAQPSEARYANVVRAGGLRVALFLPQYRKDPRTGESRGDGHLTETARELAKQIRVGLRFVEQPTPGKAIECLAAGACDHVSDFVEEAKASGVARRAIEASGYTGIHVAPRARK